MLEEKKWDIYQPMVKGWSPLLFTWGVWAVSMQNSEILHSELGPSKQAKMTRYNFFF